MKNTLQNLSDLNKSAEEITIYDIISYIKGNTNPISNIITSIQLFLKDVVIERIGKEDRHDYKLMYKGSTIYFGSCFNPYPNVCCYVL